MSLACLAADVIEDFTVSGTRSALERPTCFSESTLAKAGAPVLLCGLALGFLAGLQAHHFLWVDCKLELLLRRREEAPPTARTAALPPASMLSHASRLSGYLSREGKEVRAGVHEH
jgi:hypothetical protein